MHPAWAGAPPWLRALCAGVPALALGVATLLAAGRNAVFRDEAATRQLATLDWAELWQATGHVDRVMLPYLALVKGWVALAGEGTLVLRVPSLVATVLLVVSVAWCAGRWSGPVGAAASGAALCASPLVGSLAVFARPYAPAALAAVVALLCLDLATEPGRSHRSRRLAAWGHPVVFAGAVLLQPFAVAAAPAFLALAGLRRRPAALRLVAVGVVAGAAVALVGWLGSRSQSGQVGWIPPIAAAEVGRLVVGTVSRPVAWVAAAAVVSCVLVPAARWRPSWLVGAALVAGPVVLLGVLSVLEQPSFVARYLLLVPVGAALLCGGLAGGVADLTAGALGRRGAGGRTAAAVTASGVLVLVVTSVVIAAGSDIRPPGPRVRLVPWSANPGSPLADAVAAELQPGDRLVIEQRVGWGGYAAQLADDWGDTGMSAALDRRAVSGDLDDVTRAVDSAGPVRTSAGPAGGSGPTRVVLLSLRSSALERYLARTAAAGCRPVQRVRDGDLGDTRLWRITCEGAPAGTDLSSAPDAPAALAGRAGARTTGR